MSERKVARLCILTWLVSPAAHRDLPLVAEVDMFRVLWAERNALVALHGFPCYSLGYCHQVFFVFLKRDL